MSSTFIEIDPTKHSRKGVFKNAQPQLLWLQFVPGVVKSVITSKNSPNFRSTKDINAITAIAHISDNTKWLHATKRYYPMMRGIVDTPVKGDQVLLCTFGGINYYLGPLNTENKPNFNHDFLFESDRDIWDQFGVKPPRRTTRDDMGLSNNFTAIEYSRLQKDFDPDLDKGSVGEDYDLHGDMMFEGRHGNSIRLGSISDNPYIIISNTRHPKNELESIADGTLISITKNGTLDQYFSGTIIESIDKEKLTFILADSEAQIDKDKKRTSADLVSFVNGGADVTELIYKYDKDQLLQTSDRITINAKRESLFLSAFQNIHIGSGNSLTISSNKEIILESGNIYIGKLAKKETSEEQTETGQGLVLGEHLRFLLEQLVDILILANGHCNGIPLPLGYKGSPAGEPSLTTELNKIKSALGKGATNFVSSKYFVEDNVS